MSEAEIKFPDFDTKLTIMSIWPGFVNFAQTQAPEFDKSDLTNKSN